VRVIPDAALQQHIAVLGKTGSGKTFAAKAVIVEPQLAAYRRVGIIDPTGAWWGLRSSADGKGAGFPVLVLGGDHGDLPLPALGGAAVARLLSAQNVNLVADTSQLTVGERTRWFIDFASTLYRINRAPLSLVLDEAHNFAPQGKVPDPDTGKMLHAANTLASGGRSRGIRLTLITQRPQKLHKDALTSADTLIAMRVLAPHDREAVKAWIDGCGDPAQGRQVLDSLANLQRGEGWVWYPEGAHLQRIKFPPIWTFDSSATPTDGHALAAPKGAAEIDLAEIKAALADAVSEAEANDPKLLRKRIAELEQKLRQNALQGHSDEDIERATHDGYVRGRDEAAEHYRARLTALESLFLQVRELGEQGRNAAMPGALPSTLTKPVPVLRTQFTKRPAVDKQSAGLQKPVSAHSNGHLPTGERATLTACAQHPGGCTREQLSILTGYKRSSRDAYIQRLREKGYVEARGDQIMATDAGTVALGAGFEPLPTGAALRQYWIERLPEGERAVLDLLIRSYPDAVDRDQIDQHTGYKRSSRDAYIQRLKARQLVLIEGRGHVKASDGLF
jgi:hypothetical protein